MTAVKPNIEPKTVANPLRSLADALAPLEKIAGHSVSLIPKPLPPFEIDGTQYQVPRYLYLGPKGGGEPIRVAFIAGVYGDEPEGSFALIDFIDQVEQRP